MDKIELSKWTFPTTINGCSIDGKVLGIKSADKEGKTYGGQSADGQPFQYPQSGIVRANKFSPEPDCDTGGIFFWPWGIGIGIGKDSDYTGAWMVIAFNPDDVIEVEFGKCKAPEGDVVYYGDWGTAIMLTLPGRVAYVEAASSGSASNSGYSGSASNSGPCGSASNSGPCGSASNSGHCGSASNSGYGGSASNSGDKGSASNSGDSGNASNSGPCGSASNSGPCGSASNSGYRGGASNSGYRGGASNSGDIGSASVTGDWSIASSTKEASTLDIGAHSLGAVCAKRFYWVVRRGAIIVQRWDGDHGRWPHVLLSADELGLPEGKIVTVVKGEIQADANSPA